MCTLVFAHVKHHSDHSLWSSRPRHFLAGSCCVSCMPKVCYCGVYQCAVSVRHGILQHRYCAPHVSCDVAILLLYNTLVLDPLPIPSAIVQEEIPLANVNSREESSELNAGRCFLSEVCAAETIYSKWFWSTAQEAFSAVFDVFVTTSL